MHRIRMGALSFLLIPILVGCNAHARIEFTPGVSIKEAVAYAIYHKAEIESIGRKHQRHGQTISEGFSVDPGMTASEIEQIWSSYYKESLKRRGEQMDNLQRMMEETTDPQIKAAYRRGIEQAKIDREEAELLDEMAYGKTILVNSMTISVNPFRTLEERPEISKLRKHLF